MARKRPTQGSARSKQRSKAGLRDLDARKGGSVKGGRGVGPVVKPLT